MDNFQIYALVCMGVVALLAWDAGRMAESHKGLRKKKVWRRNLLIFISILGFAVVAYHDPKVREKMGWSKDTVEVDRR